tara:strand:+ start:1997 stop:3091 length:1095 start_codon:yes stop_codon:yes gene_type:complete
MSQDTLKQRLGVDVVCPLSQLLYGGMPSGGGFQPYTEYEIGAMRIAEACHCLLGSLGKLHDRRLDDAPWSRWRELLAYERAHLEEEFGIVVKAVHEYNRPLYTERINHPRQGYGVQVERTVHSLRERGPRLSDLARRRRDELVACDELPQEVQEAAWGAYTVLMVLGAVVREAVSRWPTGPVWSPYGDVILAVAVQNLERKIERLLVRPSEGPGESVVGIPEYVLETLEELSSLAEPYWSGMSGHDLQHGIRRARADFYDVVFASDRWMIRQEAWGEGCLSDGVGPWSSIRHGEDADWPAGTIEGRLDEYRQEAELRREDPDMRPGDPDAPPAGMTLVSERWITIPCTRDGHEAIQLTLWRRSG